MMNEFDGFPDPCLEFLQQLAQYNDKNWFETNRQRYADLVQGPALVFIREMAPRLYGISPHFRASAKKVGGSLMRVYRDTRFSKDKTPYKTNIGIQFRHELGKDIHAPGFYLHIEPGNCFIGAGIWHPDNRTLNKLRDFLVDNPTAWQAARDQPAFQAEFTLVGESLQRPPRGYPADHILLQDLKRKDFIASKGLECSQIKRRSLLDEVERSFKLTDEFMRYLCSALEIPY